MCSITVDNSRHVTPSKIVCVGQNYVAHIQELGNTIPDEMVLFCKPNSAISSHIQAEHLGDEVHYEGEFCFMIENGQFSALGFGFDLTKRSLQTKLRKQGLPWEKAKAFDGSAVFSEFISISELPEQITFQLLKNNALTQSGDSQLMMNKPMEILSEINRFMKLNDGDIIMTGTPKGVGLITKNDHFAVEVKIEDKTVIKQTWLAE